MTKKEIYRICLALDAITEEECCDYGFEEECDLAAEYIQEYEDKITSKQLKPKMKEIKYCDLKVGDEFMVTDHELIQTGNKREIDNRVFRVTQDGALQLLDVYGSDCEWRHYRMYPYLTMPVYVEDKG